MVEAKKTAEAPAPKSQTTSKSTEEGIFGGPVTHNNPRKEDVAFDGRKEADQ